MQAITPMMKEDSLLDAVNKMIKQCVGKSFNFGLVASEGVGCCGPEQTNPKIDFRRILPTLNETLFNIFDEFEPFKEAQFTPNNSENNKTNEDKK